MFDGLDAAGVCFTAVATITSAARSVGCRTTYRNQPVLPHCADIAAIL
jgi:hypothetical protein